MQEERSQRVWLWIGAGLAAWFGAVVAAGAMGWFGLVPAPAIPGFAVLSAVVVAGLYWTVGPVGSALRETSLRSMTAVHIGRMAAAPLFFWYGSRGRLPQVLVERAGWGDLVAGAVALLVVLFWARPAGYWVMNIVGIADLVDAVGTAMKLTRAHPASMRALTTLPIVVIPLFVVGLLGGLHLIAFSRLLQGEGTSRQRVPATQQ